MNITYKTLTSNEFVGLSCTEIVSVPHISILDKNLTEAEIIEEYKDDFGGLLNEIHQLYKSRSMADGAVKDISLELLWKSSRIHNQTFNANIQLYLVIRVIEATKKKAKELIESLYNLCYSSISVQKYQLKDLEEDEYLSLINSVDDSDVKAIVKDEMAENLYNPIMQYCYAYDRFPRTQTDLSKIVNILSKYPDCAISIQLIPTQINNNEAMLLDRSMQSLEMLSKGIMEQGVGNVSFSTAQKHAENYRYYSENKYHALYNYNILTYANESAASEITSKLYGQIVAGKEASANLKVISLQAQEVNKDDNLYPLPWAVNEMLLNKERNMNIWQSGQISDACYRFPYIITSEEASEIFRLPIGTDRVSAGLNINESVNSSKKYQDNIIDAGDITIGKLKSSNLKSTIGFSLKDLAKHMLVVGTPGSGKTTFSVSLLDRLWKEHHTPFLVIEPAKNEYRALIKSIPDLQVFTPGKNFVCPFVYNPFLPPKNVKLESYKSTLKTAFEAGVSMSTPLDKIFEESINNCYSDFRWLDTYTTDNLGKVFNISDFIACFERTFGAIGYTGDAQNIGRAGVVRLKSLMNLFDNYFSVPIEDILTKPTVIELAAIENSDQKSLIIALLLLSILSYVNANYLGEGGLKNVILLEEAHVLLDGNSSSDQNDSNPNSIAQGLVKRMLAEIRSYGVGLVIADQSPRKVGTDVVALTDMKVVFRLVESTDKQIVADSTNMSENQVQRLGRLKPGEAFVFYNKLEEPEEVVTPDYRLENNISITLSDRDIQSLSKYWNNKTELLRPYPECLNIKYCQNDCDYNCRILAKEVARRIFNKYIGPRVKTVEDFKKVYLNLESLIKKELNDEEYTYKLLACVKVHLLRLVKYNTKLRISDVSIARTLKNTK